MSGDARGLPALEAQTVSLQDIANAITVQCRVLNALILRETKTRYGEHKLGFVWAFLQPIVMVVVIYFIFSAMRTLAVSEIHFSVFVITGFVPFAMLRDTMTQCQGAISQNTALLGFPQVTTYDLILARALLEVSVLLVVFGLMMMGAGLLGIDVRCENPLGVLAACLLLWILGLGLGLIFASLTPIIPSVRQVTSQVLGRPLFLTSGIFYTADSIPEGIREYMLYNPVLHMIEMTRSAYFYEFNSIYASWSYATYSAFGTLAFGLVVHRAMRKKAIVGL